MFHCLPNDIEERRRKKEKKSQFFGGEAFQNEKWSQFPPFSLFLKLPYTEQIK